MKKRINVSLFIGIILGFAFTSCNKQTNIDSDFDSVVDNAYTVNNTADELNKRMSIIHEPVMFTDGTSFKGSKSAENGYTWYYVAEVAAPIFNGEPLSATDVRILGNRAYVTYNRQGSVYAGAIEVIDITDPGYPVLRSYMQFDGVDINSLAVDDQGSDAQRRIWLAGSSYKKGAILRQVIAEDGYLTGGVADISLSKALSNNRITASANGIGLSDNYIYISTGNSEGGTFQLDRQSLTFVANEEYPDAKAIALNGTSNGSYQLSLIGGDDGRLLVYRVGENRDLLHDFNLGPIVHQNVADPYYGKATVAIRPGEKTAFIAMNRDGMKAIDIETGNVVYTSPSNMLTIGNTHGLTIDNEFIYMANSDDGLFIGEFPTGGGEIREIQRWDLDETGASANMVQTDGDWVFVAKGGGGLKILRKIPNGDIPSVCEWDQDGAPTTCKMNPEALCDHLISDFKYTLPDRKDATKKRPGFFQNENREIVLNQTADVSVTFVSEGAAYKNTFGYYTYNVNNPPQSVEDIKSSMKIVFANASAQGSGGGLFEGDRLYLGTFDAGTVIGYFLIADGWNGQEVTDGLYTFYTSPQLNRDNAQQSLLLYSESCNSIITAFEDMHIDSGDRDFNDLVVKTSISPESAVNTDDMNMLLHKK